MKNNSPQNTPSKTSFGMIMSERSFSSEKYRYGFNSQEKDDEVAGSGNINTAEYWEYDCRLGRRWNVDPIIKDWESPYTCFSDNPIFFNDIHGADNSPANTKKIEKEKPMSGSSNECEIIAPKKSFWEKMGSVLDKVADYVPVVGGIKAAVRAARVGDIKGVFCGLGEAVVDGALLVTTGGLGNLAKIGVKAGVKLTAKIIVKETTENAIGEYIADGTTQLGIPPAAQIGISILLGIHGKPKPKFGKNWRARDISNSDNWNGCEDAAKQINKHIGGTIHKIEPKQTKYLGAYKNTYTGWDVHEVVVKDGKVYDAFTGSKGLDIESYKKQFTDWEEINFGF